MADKFKWCKNVHSNLLHEYGEEGREYCIFHAPKGQKKVRPDFFNSEIYRLITSAIRNNRACELLGTIFEGDISFEKYHQNNPLPVIDFSNAEFHGNVSFNGVMFDKLVSFNHTIFWGDVDFTVATFNEKALFNFTKFNEAETYSHAMSMITKEHGKKTEKNDSKRKGMADFRGVEFDGRPSFLKAIFGGDATFYGAIFKDGAIFNDTNFIKGSMFSNITLEKNIRFEHTNLTKVSFIDTDLRMVDFFDCIFPKKNANDVLYDEKVLDENGKLSEALGAKINSVEILYRQLKQKYKEEHNQQEASKWHYREKEMQRRRTSRSECLPFLLLNLYYYSSGYGEDPKKALKFLIFLFIAVSLILGILGLCPVDSDNPSYGIKCIRIWWPFDMDFRKVGAIFINTLKYSLFQRDYYLKPSTQLGEFVRFLGQIFIPIQTALFVLALRNRFRR